MAMMRASVPTVASRVKGIWFESARAWLRREHGVEALARVDARVSPAHRGILLEPVVSDWYAEDALAELLAALRVEVTDGTPDDFVRVIEAISLDGIGRFFRLLLALASPRFVLRKVPVLWARMRGGEGRVEVELADDGVELHYREFPRFADENYRLMTQATLAAVCTAAGSPAPQVEILDWTHTSLDVRVRA
jgi:hypothetical protein